MFVFRVKRHEVNILSGKICLFRCFPLCAVRNPPRLFFRLNHLRIVRKRFSHSTFSSQTIYLLQKRAVRAISKADYKASSKPLFSNLKILDVFSIYFFQVISFMYLYHNDALPISSFKLETKFINIQRDTPTI